MSVSSSQSAERVPFLRLRFSSLLALTFLGVAAIALAYVGGVMAGRASVSAERRLAAAETENPASHVPMEGGGQRLTQGMPPLEGPGILAAEELRFARALRNEEDASETPIAAQRVPSPAAAADSQKPSASTLLPGQPVAGPGGEPGTRSLPSSSVLPGGESGQTQGMAQAILMQDYVFQVGVFRDEESVDSLRQRLEGRGLRTRMQREGKLYVVLVLLRGDAARAEEVIQIAEELRLGKPVIRSRKPVQP